MRGPPGRHVLHGNWKSRCEYLATAGVSNFAKRVRRVSRFVPAAFERPQHRTDTPYIYSPRGVPFADPMAITSNTVWYIYGEGDV